MKTQLKHELILVYILVNTYILVNKLLKNKRFYLLILLNVHELTWTYN